MPTTTLVPITEDNLRAVTKLKVTEAQSHFVAPVAYSLAEAAFNPFAYARAIGAGEELVGFMLLEIGLKPGLVYLWRFLIDHEHQRCGHGKAAIAALIALANEWGASRLELSYVPGPGNPGPFYRSLGFVETGDIVDGEHVMGMNLLGNGQTLSDRHRTASRYEEAALQLETAAGQARVAARYLRDDLEPRASDHAHAARGHLLEATDQLDALARLHARLHSGQKP